MGDLPTKNHRLQKNIIDDMLEKNTTELSRLLSEVEKILNFDIAFPKLIRYSCFSSLSIPRERELYRIWLYGICSLFNHLISPTPLLPQIYNKVFNRI